MNPDYSSESVLIITDSGVVRSVFDEHMERNDDGEMVEKRPPEQKSGFSLEVVSDSQLTDTKMDALQDERLKFDSDNHRVFIA